MVKGLRGEKNNMEKVNIIQIDIRCDSDIPEGTEDMHQLEQDIRTALMKHGYDHTNIYINWEN